MENEKKPEQSSSLHEEQNAENKGEGMAENTENIQKEEESSQTPEPNTEDNSWFQTRSEAESNLQGPESEAAEESSSLSWPSFEPSSWKSEEGEEQANEPGQEEKASNIASEESADAEEEIVIHDAIGESGEPEIPTEAELIEAVTGEVEQPMAEESIENVPEEKAAEAEATEELPEEQEEEISLEGLGKPELLRIVQEAIHFAESRTYNERVVQARTEFFKIIEEERKEAKEQFLLEPENKEADFQAPADPVIAEFNQAFKAFKNKRKAHIEDINRQRDINLQMKKEILEKLKEITESTETQTSLAEMKRLQEEWRRIGHVPMAEAEKLWTLYHFYVNKFYDQFSLYSEFKDLDRKRNLSMKDDIVQGIEKLAEIEDMAESMKQLRQYQEEWRHIGPVPKENAEDLIGRYRAAVGKVHDKREQISAELHKRREQNYEAKNEILAKIEEIAAFQSNRTQEWIDKNKELRGWMEKWRAIGSVPAEQREEMKQRLSNSIKGFNKAKNDFFRENKREKLDNYRKKLALCEQVEAFLTEEDFGAHRKEVIAMQEEWKKIGPVPVRYSDNLWKRFHTACDTFFKKLSEIRQTRDKELYENLAKKNALIERLEALAKEGQTEDAQTAVQEIQDEWRATGHVPFKEKDSLNQRFMDAIRKVPGRSGRGRQMEQTSYRTMIEGWRGGAEGGRRIGDEERRLTRDLRKLEDEIATLENNMQFLSSSKTADTLKNNLNDQINRLRSRMGEIQDKIRILKTLEAPAKK